jgi:Tfp pilus assembly protein PilV
MDFKAETGSFKRPPERAFSLLEVMIAVAIFFVAVFAILDLVAQNLRYVRNLQKPKIDIGSLAAELSLTNALEEGTANGDFGDLYPNATWDREIVEVGTNGLFKVDFTVTEQLGRSAAESRLTIILFRPESESTGFGPSRAFGR